MSEKQNPEKSDFRKFADAMAKTKSMLEEKRVRENPPEFEKFDKLILWMQLSIAELRNLGFISERFIILFPPNSLLYWTEFYVFQKYRVFGFPNVMNAFQGIQIQEKSPENSVFIYVKDTFPVVSRKFDLVENGFIKK